MFKKVAGIKDILPEEISYWQKIEATARTLFSTYNYREIRTPIIEAAGLFGRSLGEFTEIVRKQMFCIKNKKETYVLRPEGTAPVIRAYLENNLDKTQGFIKLYYLGPMFRLERPQKGRLRQFHHLGVEVIGSDNSETDVEVISLAGYLLEACQIKGYKLQLNSLGCTKDKEELTRFLEKALKKKITGLCNECGQRYQHNILRILDCKEPLCQEIVKKIGWEENKHLCGDCAAHFTKVRAGLDAQKIQYSVNPLLVRGLDYYTRTVFEIKHASLGAQDALGAGGRYDNLIKELGGPEKSAVGFAFGIERLLLAGRLTSHHLANQKELVFIITLGKETRQAGLDLLNRLRQAGIAADIDYEGRSLKGAMRKACDLGAQLVAIIGENELQKNLVALKDMRTGEQREIKIENLIQEIRILCYAPIPVEN